MRLIFAYFMIILAILGGGFVWNMAAEPADTRNYMFTEFLKNYSLNGRLTVWNGDDVVVLGEKQEETETVKAAPLLKTGLLLIAAESGAALKVPSYRLDAIYNACLKKYSPAEIKRMLYRMGLAAERGKWAHISALAERRMPRKKAERFWSRLIRGKLPLSAGSQKRIRRRLFREDANGRKHYQMFCMLDTTVHTAGIELYGDRAAYFSLDIESGLSRKMARIAGHTAPLYCVKRSLPL